MERLLGEHGKWATRRRSDPGKLAIAARLRSETTLPIKWIAARVQIGTAKGAKSVLHHLAQSQDQRKTASALEPCAQLEFQSTVDPYLTLHPIPLGWRAAQRKRPHMAFLSAPEFELHNRAGSRYNCAFGKGVQ